MIHRERITYPTSVYPLDEWRMVEKRYYPAFLPQTESFFSVGNGYIGMRGNVDEGRPVYKHSSLVNGFYESWPIVYGEEAYGFAKTGQTIVNVPDCKIIKLYVDDEPLYLPRAELDSYRRELDMKSGYMERELIWETPYGKKVSVLSRRLVSFKDRHLAAILYDICVLDADAPVTVASELQIHRDQSQKGSDPREAENVGGDVLEPVEHRGGDLRMVQGYRTRNSHMSLACAMDHLVETENRYTSSVDCREGGGTVVFNVDAKQGRRFRIVKYIAYTTSAATHPRELGERCEWVIDRAVRAGYDSVVVEQKAFMKRFWEHGDVRIEGDPRLQQAIRFNLFQLLQAAGRTEDSGVPAKGLTGEGYGGHYFWDTEIYMLPYFIYTFPRVARNLLRFRYHMLDKARERARVVGHAGALFPWRTINGEEASAYYAAGTAQYHINADIMYALRTYVEATGDEDFLFECGAEMLVETARLWLDLGHYSERRGGKFCIDGVTGPDEYNTVVNNNTFTNLMARENLWYAAQTVRRMHDSHRDAYETLAHRTGLAPHEAQQWREAADAMYLPYDERMGVHPQDEAFLDKEPWDLDTIPSEKFPLLLHYHPLVIYRHQVIKQADVVLAMFLLGDEFSLEEKRRNFDYYDTLTTGDSSLSVSIQSIIAFELGDVERAMEYLRYAMMMDLGDVGGNVKSGLHMASIGGTWMAAVNGIAGMRDYGGRLSFRPRLPHSIRSMRFPLTVQGRRIEVILENRTATYTLLDGDTLTIDHNGRTLEITGAKPTVSVDLEPDSGTAQAAERDRSTGHDSDLAGSS